MNERLTEIVYILDRSGSMTGLEKDTIGGYNGFLEKQKSEEGDAVVTTVLFDDKYELVHDRVDIKKISPLTEREYYARGMTALLDAVGKTIKSVEQRHRSAIDSEVPGKTIFVITTDGQENSSREYTAHQIKSMIETLKKEREWEFLFLGANIDAVDVAAKYGIDKDRSVKYCADEAGTELNFNAIHNVVSDMRARRPVASGWKKNIESYEKRKK